MRIDGPQVTSSLSLNGTTITDLNVFVTTGSLNGLTGSYATTGSNLFNGTQTLSGSIIPAVNNTYDLGSPTNQFRHVYISSGSLYVNGVKVLGSTSQELQITTDVGQSFKILESGSDTITLQSGDGNVTLTSSGQGDIVLDPTTGVIGLKGTVTIYTGNKIVSSDGNSIQFGNGIAVTGSIVSTTTSLVSGSSQITYSGLSGVPSDIISGSGQLTTLGIATTGSNTFNGNLTVTGFIDTQELRTTYISSSILYRSGSTKFGDELTDTHSFTGSILISGSISVPGSNLVSGSSQVLNGSGVWSGSAQLPSGVISGSAQVISSLPTGTVSGSAQVVSLLPSGTVSGSVQVDVMSTTNIARLATTGSNTFSGNIRTTGLSIGVAPTSNILDVRGENGTFDGTIVLGARGTIQHRDGGQTILSIANDYNSDSAKMEFRMKGNTTGDAKLTILGSGASTFSSTLQANGKIFLQRASTGADTLLQFKNEVGVDKAYIKFGGVNEELAFYSGAGGTRNLIIDADGSMGFNTPTFGVRSFLFKAIAGRQLAIEALESGGVHAIYLRPSSSGRNLITSNYFSGGAYLPLALSGRENDVDLVLHTNGNISVGSATDGGVKLAITGANSADGQLYVGNTDVTYSAGVNFTTSGTNRGFVGWRHTNSGAPFTLTGIHLFNIDNSNIVFGTNNTIKAVINVDGNLGINTTTPTQKLHVAGYIRTNGVSVFKTGGSIAGFIGHEQDWLGTGSSNNLICASEGGNDFKVFTNGGTAERITATTTGYVYLGKGWGATNHRINLEVAQGNRILVVSAYAGASNDSVLISAASGANPNDAGTTMGVTTNSSTGRSISAGGTINASGNDYAEYMLKAVTDTISKGDIVGIDNEGLLTNIFSDSVSFVVKSTNPSYVGGDAWGTVVGKRPERTTDQTEEEFAPILAEFEAKLEVERQKVDRIAFSGQVPVNVTGATVGDYIIPMTTEDGKITGQAITNPSFDQYKISVGKVWKIMEDGRAFIAIKIG